MRKIQVLRNLDLHYSIKGGICQDVRTICLNWDLKKCGMKRSQNKSFRFLVKTKNDKPDIDGFRSIKKLLCLTYILTMTDIVIILKDFITEYGSNARYFQHSP